MKYKNDVEIHTLEQTTTVCARMEPGEVIIGTLVDFDQNSQPRVNFLQNDSQKPLIAISTLDLNQKHVGRQVALLFTGEQLQSPVIMGVIHSPLQDMLESFEQTSQTSEASQSSIDDSSSKESKAIELESDLGVDDVTIDGKKIVFEAQNEIVLKCGESSITLTHSGKILIRGKYLLNRSTGVNRIMGGSVQVN